MPRTRPCSVEEPTEGRREERKAADDKCYGRMAGPGILISVLPIMLDVTEEECSGKMKAYIYV